MPHLLQRRYQEPKLGLTKKNEEQEKCNSTYENCYFKNIYHPADTPLCAKFPKEQTNENWNLTLIKVSVFYFLNENYFEWIITNYWIGLLYDLKYYVDQTHPHPNIANYLTHLGIVLSFPCRIRGILPWLLETNTPDELSVIHSTAAEPPNSGTENRGALMEKKKDTT